MSARFTKDLADFMKKLDRRMDAVFLDAVGVALESIKIGHAISGAPGQPVQTGNLLNSWDQKVHSKTTATLFSTADYAEHIEEGIGMTVRSAVGGFHSVKMTVAAWSRIMNASVEKVVSQEGE